MHKLVRTCVARRLVARAVMLSALSIAVAAQALAAEDASTGEPLALWDAMGAVVPERWTVRLRWLRQDTALFEVPTARQAGRIRVRTLYPCRLNQGRWTCTGPDEEIDVEAHGMRHTVHVTDVERSLAVRIVDYVYSECFETQREELRRTRAKFYWGQAKIPISRIVARGNGVIEVDAAGTGSGLIFRIEAAAPADAGSCGFRLINLSGWIAMRPNSSSSGRESA